MKWSNLMDTNVDDGVWVEVIQWSIVVGLMIFGSHCHTSPYPFIVWEWVDMQKYVFYNTRNG